MRMPHGAAINASYPNEPSIALKGSQTIFPLNRDFCLILTNLECAQDHSAMRVAEVDIDVGRQCEAGMIGKESNNKIQF